MAKIKEYKSIFNLLVEKGADRGVEDDDGNTIESYQQSERGLWESYQADAHKARKQTCQRNSHEPESVLFCNSTFQVARATLFLLTLVMLRCLVGGSFV